MRQYFWLIFNLFILTSCLENKKFEASNPPVASSKPQAKIQCERSSLSENSLSLVNGVPANLTCTITLSKFSAEDTKINLSISGIATHGIDYSTISNQLTISKNTLDTSFNVIALDDSSYEPNETITFKILPSSDGVTPYDVDALFSEANLTILDDDLLLVNANLNVNPFQQYKLDEANPAQYLTWTIYFYNKITNAPVTLPFDVKFTPSAQSGLISVSRLTNEIQNITVPKNSSSYSFSFGVINDQLPQPIQTDFIVLTPEPSVTFSPTSMLVSYLTLYDDEIPLIKLITVSKNTSENGGTTVYKVTSNATLTSSLQVALTYGGNATRGSDYTGSGGNDVVNYLTIPAGTNESTTTSLFLVGDGIYDPNESVTISLSPNSNLYSIGSPSQIGIGIVDDVTATPEIRSIELTSSFQSNPPAITVDWTGDNPGSAYKIYRKLMSESNFPTTPLTTSSINTNSYIDNSVSINTKYEYKVEKADGIAYGYIATGVNLTEVHDQGGVLIVAESNVASSLSSEISQWTMDMADDGFHVSQINVGINDPVTQVKTLINQSVSNSSGNIKYIILFGHVPVPYSGLFAPDGHSDHIGAWPTDGYYADLDTQSKWTDTTVNSNTASRIQNRNIPGDGKFDQSTFPLALQLQVGRIDLANLPAFSPLTEVDLLRRYLNKNHNYRKKLVQVPTRALFDDNWGTYGGGDFFGTSMWRSISAIVGKANIAASNNAMTSDWFTQLETNNYLFAYGGGAGNYTSVSGIGTTGDFATKQSKAVFTALLGSYFGDWDSTDNVLRAPLAADGLGLTSVWSGLPEWYFHQMGIGETVGYSAMKSMNNINAYAGNFYPNYVHMALMGDPTLKAYVVAPASNLISQINSNQLQLDWQASSDGNVDGYFVYYATQRQGPYSLQTATPTTSLNYVTTALTGTHYYMIRATKWESTPAGGFRNLSSGITKEVINP